MWLLILPLSLAAACAAHKPVHTALRQAAGKSDVLALYDALETLIAEGKDTPEDRQYAYDVVSRHDEDTAAAQFARAAVTGRLVQLHGLRMAGLVREVERCARRSRELDPNFREGAATRLLGTLYIMAPARLLQHGNSETGLDLLEGLTAAHPEVVQNHLRLAEAYIGLGDIEPARPHLCRCLVQKGVLRRDEQVLLGQLMVDAGPFDCPEVPEP